MPIHGEYRHLYSNKEIAEFMGIPSSNIIMSDLGRVLEIKRHGAELVGNVPSGNVLVDGAGIGDIGAVVLRDRRHLAEDGLVVVAWTQDSYSGMILSEPEIITRGFIYVKESEELIDEARSLVKNIIETRSTKRDRQNTKNAVRDEISRFFFKRTKRRPMVLSLMMEV